MVRMAAHRDNFSHENDDRKVGRFSIGIVVILAALASTPVVSAQAKEQAVVEEIVVTARKRTESAQKVPATVTSLTGATLDQFQIDTIAEIGARVPNFGMIKGGSGTGGAVFLRGIGTNPVSAAFDSAIAFNIDGVINNTMRLVQNSFLDLQQVDVLKGPQSLYFGKSATAGVIAMRSRDPGDEFETELKASYEFEDETRLYSGYVSGPMGSRFGARLAFQHKHTDELWKNTAPVVNERYRGEESFDSRLTLVWDPHASLQAKLKIAYSDFTNDGAASGADVECPSDAPQNTGFAGNLLSSGQDCDPFDHVLQRSDVSPQNNASFQELDDGAHFQDQEVLFGSLNFTWDVTDALTLTSLTGWFDVEERGSDTYTFDVTGFGVGLSANEREAFSQEIRVQSHFDAAVNFMVGAYYQNREIIFDTAQNAFGLANIFGPDIFTGETYDWHKIHTTDTEAISGFASIDAALSERLEVTAGVRYSYEEAINVIQAPYVHFATAFVFAGRTPLFSGFRSPEIKFDDDNWSPEASIRFRARDNVMLYAAYKTGWKSGGVDNSALPSNLPPEAYPTLVYQSEDAEGFELGVKSELADRRVRLNATAYWYEYTDLQQQEFDSANLQFRMLNAGEATSQGFEAETVWLPPVNGLTLHATVAWTDAEYTDDYLVNVDSANETNLKGQDIARSAKWTGNVGFDYDGTLGADMQFGFSVLARYSSDYAISDDLDRAQDDFWVVDVQASVGSADGRWQLALIGANVFDEVYVRHGGGRPFTVPLPADNGAEDLVLNISRGVQFSVEARYRL